MADLRTEFRTEITALQRDLAGVSSTLRSEINEARSDLTATANSVADQIHRDIQAMQKRVILLLAATLMTVVLASAGLG